MSDHDVGRAIEKAETMLVRAEGASPQFKDKYLQLSQASALIAIAKGIDELVEILKPATPKPMIADVVILKGKGVK